MQFQFLTKSDAIRDVVAVFQAIKTRLVNIGQKRSGKTNEELETAIKHIISEAINADIVIDIFDAAGLIKPNIEILDEKFYRLKTPAKDFSVELLKKSLKDEIKNGLK